MRTKERWGGVGAGVWLENENDKEKETNERA